MPAERVAMRQAREIIRLKFSAGLKTREIARRLGMAPSTARETLRRFERAGLGWPLPDGLNDADVEAALYGNRGSKRGHRGRAEPDWLVVHRELRRKHVTLLIVWDEYIAANPGGYSYSRFCELYRGFESKLSPTMRQTHVAGERPIRRLGVTRRQLLEEIDRPALKSLPAEPYEFSEWRRCRVGIDYHVEVAAHYYSVPHRAARAEVDARLTARTIEIFLKGERIAVHMRAGGNHGHTTVPEHMPSSHRRYAGWTIERIRADARLIGPATAGLCELILEARSHPEQGFRACLGIVRLAGPFGAERLEAAAERAIDIGARTYGSVKSILDNNLDRRPARKRATDATPILHSNIRGSRYYN